MAVGNFIWFDQALKKIADGDIDLVGDTFKAMLCTSAQALSAGFNGTSTDCRKSDLTAELSTANGYTAGGVALSGVTLSRSANVVKWTSSAIGWTITGGGIAFKYLVIYDDTAANDDLLCFVDIDESIGTDSSVVAGALTVTPAGGGILTWEQP